MLGPRSARIPEVLPPFVELVLRERSLVCRRLLYPFSCKLARYNSFYILILQVLNSVRLLLVASPPLLLSSLVRVVQSPASVLCIIISMTALYCALGRILSGVNVI